MRKNPQKSMRKGVSISKRCVGYFFFSVFVVAKRVCDISTTGIYIVCVIIVCI